MNEKIKIKIDNVLYATCCVDCPFVWHDQMGDRFCNATGDCTNYMTIGENCPLTENEIIVKLDERG